jgi:hypothetical protein
MIDLLGDVDVIDAEQNVVVDGALRCTAFVMAVKRGSKHCKDYLVTCPSSLAIDRYVREHWIC